MTDPFQRSDEATPAAAESERLRAFTKALWDALVPPSGECIAVQGELVRANERLQSELFRNGLSNYYCQEGHGPGGREGTVADNHYGKLLLFLLGTLVANRNGALDAEDVAYFEAVLRLVSPDWERNVRIGALTSKLEDSELEGTEGLSEAERAELEALESEGGGPPWEELFSRAARCLANWCLANPELVDRGGNAVEERGLRDVRHVFEPPPPPPPCPLCKGKGWIAAADPTGFAEPCACKRTG